MPPSDVLDQEIIDCLVLDDPKALGALAKRAGGMVVLRTRAREIGLTREFLRTCREAQTRAGMRACMNCDRDFLSWSPRNRLCKRCSGS